MTNAPHTVRRIPGLAWPDGVRCAVNVTIDYDAQLARRAGNEPPLELTEGEFGGRTGIWRLLDLAEKHGIGLTLFVPGRIAELYPASLREAARRGFEIAAHMWDHTTPTDPRLQRDHLAKATAALEAISGKRPIGQRAHGWHQDILIDQQYLYVSNDMADDRPYYLTQNGRSLLNLPFFWALDDAMYFKFGWLGGIPSAQRISDVEPVYQNWLAAFRRIHADGGYMNLCLHDMHSGRAARIAMLDRLFTELRRTGGVWFPTCEQLTRYTLERFPIAPE
ncbi:MAG: polysaccharide deacetylase family protein [Lautropia sp.]